MKKSESLKKNHQFQFVYKNGKSYANKYLVMYVEENGTGRNRIGISVSRKVGNSVVRHRITRLVRESYRLHEALFNSGLDIVIVARRNAASVAYGEVEKALLHLGKLHRILSFEQSRLGNEKIIDCRHPVLPEIPVSPEKNEMSLYSLLFTVWAGGGGKVRGIQRRAYGCLEDTALQPFLQRGIRPGPVKTGGRGCAVPADRPEFSGRHNPEREDK